MNWKRVESTNRPQEFDTTLSKKWNYVRKNITEEQREAEGGTVTMYVYDELKVLKEDWELFMSVEEQKRSLADGETSIAKTAHSVGEYITVDGVFCEVIAGICAGETISLGRNVKAVNIGSVLANLRG